MLIIEKDWRAQIGNACWSWILCWIPLAIKAVSVATTNYSFDGRYILTQESGIITRKTVNIDLRRARMVNGSDSPFSGGKLTITESNGSTFELPYVKDARRVAQNLRNVAEESSRRMGDTRNVIIG